MEITTLCLLGIAQFFLDGRALVTALRGIDQSLANQSLSVFLIGGALIVVALRWGLPISIALWALILWAVL